MSTRGTQREQDIQSKRRLTQQ